jgi:hypothetical protein
VVRTLAVLLAGASPGLAERVERFDADPGWIGHGNTLQRVPCVTLEPDVRWRPTSAVQPGAPGGEVGGPVERSLTGHAFSRPVFRRTLDDASSFAVRVRVVAAERNGIALIGLFDRRSSRDWRTPSSVALRLAAQGDSVLASLEYGTRRHRAGGVFLPGRVRVGRTYRLRVGYSPRTGRLTARMPGVGTAELTLGAADRADGAALDRFGIWNARVGASEDGTLTPYLDDLSIDGAPTDPLTATGDAWGGAGAMGRRFTDCALDGNQLFGWTPRRGGMIGGRIWRTEQTDPRRLASYAAPLRRRLTLRDHLRATGTFTVTQAASDSGLHLGFFRRDSRVRRRGGEVTPPNALVMTFTGVSREGLFVVPQATTRDGRLFERETWVLPAFPGPRRRFALDYDPGPPLGPGRLTLTTGSGSLGVDVPLAAKVDGATFDRFGMLTFQRDGHSQTVFFDDLAFTGMRP